jgi:hypothetical protein
MGSKEIKAGRGAKPILTQAERRARAAAGETSRPAKVAKSAAAPAPEAAAKPGAPQTNEDSLVVRSALTQALKANKRLMAITGIVEASVFAALTPPPALVIPKAPAKQGRKPSEEVAFMHLSDTQLGKETASYNSEIGCRRILDYFRKCIHLTDIRRNGATIKEVHLALGGDIIEGESIFGHQPHLIDQCVYDQACQTAPAVIAEGILLLLAHFERVKVVCVPGNHGRSGDKHGTNHPRSNWDNVVYSTLRAMLLGPPSSPRKDPELKRLEIVLADDYYVVDRIYDWGLLIVHGDQINGGGGGFPLAGTVKKMVGWSDALDKAWDYLYFGHFHTYQSGTLNHRQWFCNGTTESDNLFAQEKLAATGPASQRLQFYSKDYGVIADMQVYVADRKMPQSRRFQAA